MQSRSPTQQLWIIPLPAAAGEDIPSRLALWLSCSAGTIKNMFDLLKEMRIEQQQGKKDICIAPSRVTEGSFSRFRRRLGWQYFPNLIIAETVVSSEVFPSLPAHCRADQNHSKPSSLQASCIIELQLSCMTLLHLQISLRSLRCSENLKPFLKLRS